MSNRTLRWGVVPALLLCAGLARAGDAPCLLHGPSPTPPPKPTVGATPRSARDAGYPFCLNKHAIPSDNGRYAGYYLGGGSFHGGDLPCRGEGTYGWDYAGVGSRVMLNWSHGRRYQGGIGRYATEGPRPTERIKEHFHGE